MIEETDFQSTFVWRVTTNQSHIPLNACIIGIWRIAILPGIMIMITVVILHMHSAKVYSIVYLYSLDNHAVFSDSVCTMYHFQPSSLACVYNHCFWHVQTLILCVATCTFTNDPSIFIMVAEMLPHRRTPTVKESVLCSSTDDIWEMNKPFSTAKITIANSKGVWAKRQKKKKKETTKLWNLSTLRAHRPQKL